MPREHVLNGMPTIAELYAHVVIGNDDRLAVVASRHADPQRPSEERHFEQWIFEGPSHVAKRFWKLGAKREDGDGTVPLRSLLGFGGPAKIFNPLPGSPEHVPAPNSDWLWDRVLEVLQGVNVQQHLSSGDPREGKE